MSEIHESPPKAGRQGASAKRVLKLVLLASFALVGLLILGLIAFAHTASSARLAAGRVTQGYGERIAGSIEMAEVEGSLARGMELHELKMHDRDGRPLFTLDHLRLDASLMEMLQGRFRLEELLVEGATIVLPAEGEPGFADLRPEPKDEEEREREAGEGGQGSLFAKVSLKEVRVLQRETPDQALADARLLGHLGHADLVLSSEAGQGELSLDLALEAPALDDLAVESAKGSATWSEGVITLGPTDIDSSWGRATIDGLRVDPTQGWFELESARVVANPEFFAARTGVTPEGEPYLEAHGRLGLEGSDFELVTDLSGAGEGKAHIWAEDASTMLLRYELDAAWPVSRWSEDTHLEALSVSAEGRVESIALGAWGVSGKVECHGCESGDANGPTDATVELDGRVSAMNGSANAHVEAAVAGGELDLTLQSGPESDTKLDGVLNTTQAERFVAWLGRFGVEVPEGKALGLRFSCGGEGVSTLLCELTQGTRRPRELPLADLPLGVMRALGFVD